jgi:hypothetical protein
VNRRKIFEVTTYFLFRVAALSFVFLFLLWLSGSLHFILGMVLYDSCPVVDTVVQGMLPDSEAGEVLNGCLYKQESVLESLNITAYNLTDVFNYILSTTNKEKKRKEKKEIKKLIDCQR